MILAKAPSGRELAPQATEGERVAVKFNLISKSRRLLPSRYACHLPPGGRLSLVRICAQFQLCGEKKVKYSAIAECEIIHFVNCEILLPLLRNDFVAM